MDRLFTGPQKPQPPLEVALASPLIVGGAYFAGPRKKTMPAHSTGTEYASVHAAVACPVQNFAVNRLFQVKHSPNSRGAAFNSFCSQIVQCTEFLPIRRERELFLLLLHG